MHADDSYVPYGCIEPLADWERRFGAVGGRSIGLQPSQLGHLALHEAGSMPFLVKRSLELSTNLVRFSIKATDAAIRLAAQSLKAVSPAGHLQDSSGRKVQAVTDTASRIHGKALLAKCP